MGETKSETTGLRACEVSAEASGYREMSGIGSAGVEEGAASKANEADDVESAATR
jgi:hypothetical protein